MDTLRNKIFNEAELMPLRVDIQYDRSGLPLQVLSRKRQIIQKYENHIENYSAEM
jgi:hypothetical protein